MSAFSKSTECFEARWETEHVNYYANLTKPALGRSAHALLEAAIGTRLILPPLDQFTFLKMLEAVGQGGMGNISRLSQIFVFAQTQRQVAQDQNCPAIADGIEHPGDRTSHSLKTLRAHLRGPPNNSYYQRKLAWPAIQWPDQEFHARIHLPSSHSYY
jgi:hypothetical protein